MSTWSLLIISAGIMAVDPPHEGASKASSALAAPGTCVCVQGGVAQLGFTTEDSGHIQQTSHSEVCAAPAACTPVSCAAAAQHGCGNNYGNCSCGNCPCGCDEDSCCDRCKNRCEWCRAHTTGDMYPHYAYYPEHHGYYYFRPYNWMHVLEHQARIVGMGGDSRNPYSVAMFDAIYEDYYQRFPPTMAPPAGSIQPLGPFLPNLEDLLNDRD